MTGYRRFMRARRAVAVGAAALAVTFGASACDSSPVAASVNGTEIKQAELRTVMREFASSPNFVATYNRENSQPQENEQGQVVPRPSNFSPNVQGSAPGTFSATFTNFVLNDMINAAAVHERVASQHIVVSSGALAAARVFYELNFPGWFQFSASLRDMLVRWQAEAAEIEPPAGDLTSAESQFSQSQGYFFQQVCVRQVSVVELDDKGAVDDDASLMRANQLEAADFSGGGSSSAPTPSSTTIAPTTTPTTAPAIGAAPTTSTTSTTAPSSTTSSTDSSSSSSSTDSSSTTSSTTTSSSSSSTASASSTTTVPSSTTTTAPPATTPGIGQPGPSTTAPTSTTPAPSASTSTSTTVPAPGSGTPQQAGGSIVCYTPSQLEQQGVSFFQQVLGLAPGHAAPPAKNKDGGYTIVAVDTRKLLPFDAGVGQVIAVLTDKTGSLQQVESKVLAAARVHVNPGFGSWSPQDGAEGQGLAQPRLPSDINPEFGYSLTGS